MPTRPSATTWRGRSISFGYKLKLKGLDTEEAKPDPETVEEMFEINEAIQDSTNAKQLREVREGLQKTIAELKKEVSAAFVRDDFEQMAVVVHRLKYYVKADLNAEERVEQKKCCEKVEKKRKGRKRRQRVVRLHPKESIYGRSIA